MTAAEVLTIDPDQPCGAYCCDETAGQHIFDRGSLFCPDSVGERNVGIEPVDYIPGCWDCDGSGWLYDPNNNADLPCLDCHGTGEDPR